MPVAGGNSRKTMPLMTRDLVLLIYRLYFGSFMFFGHGLGKLRSYESLIAGFPDPLGIGVKTSAFLVIFTEALCPLTIMAGLLTRISAALLTITMLVAALIQLAPEPFATKELALMYAGVFAILAITGAGRFSLDQIRRPFSDSSSV